MEMISPVFPIPEASSASAHPFCKHVVEWNSKELIRIAFEPLLMKPVIV
jgi:hypothetical protein